jgi:hypothetical protein
VLKHQVGSQVEQVGRRREGEQRGRGARVRRCRGAEVQG